MLILSLIFADFLWLRYGYWLLAGAANLLFLVFVYYELLWVRRRAIQRFIREWKEQHPNSAKKVTTG